MVLTRMMYRERLRLAEILPTDDNIGKRNEFNHFLKIFSDPDLFLRVRAVYWFSPDLTFEAEILEVFTYPDLETHEFYKTIFLNKLNPN